MQQVTDHQDKMQTSGVAGDEVLDPLHATCATQLIAV